MPATEHVGVTLTAVKSCLVATLHANLPDKALDGIRDLTLERVSRNNFTAVIFDLSAVPLMDCYEFEELGRLREMLRLLGCRMVLVGLAPGLVAYLINQDVNIDFMEVAQGLEDALQGLLPNQLVGRK